ncbi:hypothetical protein GDO78_007629 [Eleutherodactylus coqui]|uniref:RNA helicase n=1 Tax=Eleutherodactylus coqui TaxID=57060 RepID=A0A8J6FH16_ELECQ|nr:hypothetical protein GDO78_007629 [Eleutherodactylus coqui]
MSHPSSMSPSPSTVVKPGASKSGKAKGLKDIRIDEEVKIAVNIALDRFRYNDQKEMEFPSSLTSTERAFIHRLAQSLGLISKSKGKGTNRYLTIRKKDGAEACRAHMSCCLVQNAKHAMRSLIQRFPVTNKERTELLPKTERGNIFALEAESREMSKTSGRLSNGIPQVPVKRGDSDFDTFRQSLPVFEKHEEIVQIIKDNKVVLIVGETGSGKTTQRVSPKTLLTFCTNGVLLRTLMAGDTTLSAVTHVIVDEVHERDQFSDFLLTKLRDLIQKHPTLKLILSSAALDVNLFLRYFEGCPVLYIQGRPFEVKEMFLEDILRTTGYTNKDMLKYKKEKQCEEKQKTTLSEWHSVKENIIKSDTQRQRNITNVTEDYDLLDDGGDTVFSQLTEKDVNCLEPWLIKEMDSCLSDIWLHREIDAFAQLFQLILTENVSVDYRHSETSASPLMVAAGRGFLSQVEQLIGMGANIHTKASNGWTALDWARHFGQTEVVDLLESYSATLEPGSLDENSLVQIDNSSLSVEEQELLRAYHFSFDDEKVDLDLIMHIIYNICQNSDSGAILIFLPGYDEIVGLRDRILYDDKRFAENSHRYQIFMLHSNMQTVDQKRVLKTPPVGIRKIILSTNIAETSITVNDVVFVIDSGKVKEKSYDALNHVTMLKMVWISKASAIQRKGRAGRCQPGVCFRLFSRLRFQNMLEFQTPELLRMPLHQIPPENGQAAAIQVLPTDWLIYDEMTRAHRIANIRCCSVVTPATIAIFSGPAKLPSNALQEPSLCRATLDGNESSDSEMEDKTTAVLATLKLDEFLHFKLDLESANLLLQLRQKWYSLFLRRMKSPSKPWSQVDEATIRAVISMLTAEEQSVGLQQPSGIGQRPRPMSSEELPVSSSWRSSHSHKNAAETDFDELCNLDSSRTIKTPSLTFSQQPKPKERILQHPKRLEEKVEQLSVKYPESSSYSSPCGSPSPPASIKSSKSPSPRSSMPVRYFILKSSNLRNLDISQQKGVWSTTPNNERKLNRAFWESSTVYLVFSVQGSGHFQGFARMCSEIGQEKSPDWGSTSLGGVFRVEWIRKESLPFQQAHHLLNPWNENKKVQISRDGQELEPQVGEQLLLLWDRVLLGDRSVSY